jgi:hypothetical protein
MLLTVLRVEEWSFPSVISRAIEGSLVPLKRLSILPLVVEIDAGAFPYVVVDGAESGRVVLSECLLTAIEGSLVPLKRLSILPLVVENRGHVVDGAESGRVVLSECLLRAIEGSLVPLKRLSILPLVVENRGHVVDGAESVRVVLSECLLEPSRARWYHSSAFPYSPWWSKTEAMLLTV